MTQFWLSKIAESDKEIVERNIERLNILKTTIHKLSDVVTASGSAGFTALGDLLKDNLVENRPKLKKKLLTAFEGENHSIRALDAPGRVSFILKEAEEMIKREIIKQESELRVLSKDN